MEPERIREAIMQLSDEELEFLVKLEEKLEAKSSTASSRDRQYSQ